MIFALLSLIAGIFAIKASENIYSQVICGRLENLNPGTQFCNRELVEGKNKYCDGNKFFFNEAELGKFIDESKLIVSDYEKQTKAAKALIDEQMKLADTICGKISECHKMFDVMKSVSYTMIDASYDIAMGSYGMANTFNLGAVCLGANPEGHFTGTKPVITKDILDRLEDLCNGSIDMTESYLNQIAKAYGKIDSSVKTTMMEAFDYMFKMLRESNTCSITVRSIEFQEGLLLFYEISDAMANVLDVFNDSDEYFACVMEHLDNIDFCDNIIDLNSIPERAEASLEKILSISLRADDGNFIVDDKAGYDMYAAAKGNPEYKAMTADIPSSMTGGGLAGWAIAVIVIAVLVVLAGVGVAVYCLVIKPKKGQKI